MGEHAAAAAQIAEWVERNTRSCPEVGGLIGLKLCEGIREGAPRTCRLCEKGERMIRGECTRCHRSTWIYSHARPWCKPCGAADAMPAGAVVPAPAEAPAPVERPVSPPLDDSPAARIAAACDAVKALLLEKNEAYGNSALNPVRVFSQASAEEQLLVRIDDKLSRLVRGREYPGDDTVRDLVGYLMLLLVLRGAR